jgi:hypothetical protein
MDSASPFSLNPPLRGCPTAVASDKRRFGFFGVSLALVKWFTGAGFIVMFGACAGATLADDTGEIGCLAPGPRSFILKAGVAPTLTPPTRRLTLINAIGIDNEAERGPDANPSP